MTIKLFLKVLGLVLLSASLLVISYELYSNYSRTQTYDAETAQKKCNFTFDSSDTLCEGSTRSGWKFDQETQQCIFIDAGFGCSGPPFNTKRECKKACLQ